LKRLKRYKYEHYAILCQLAYSSDPRYSLDLSIYQQAKFFDSSNKLNVRVIWQKNKREVAVVFRGSYCLRDWLSNLCCFPSFISKGDGRYWVHWGVHQLLKQPCNYQDETQTKPLNMVLDEVLGKLVKEGKKIAFVGHSTGGAMAVLYADWFERKYPGKTKRVVTFGQPSFAGRSFQKLYKLPHKTYRICCDIDMVTFLPPLPFIYIHVGKMLWLHDDEIYENMASWKRLALTLKSWLLGPISNHFMHKYIRHKGLFDEH
jgi:predicted lipase